MQTTEVQSTVGFDEAGGVTNAYSSGGLACTTRGREGSDDDARKLDEVGIDAQFAGERGEKRFTPMRRCSELEESTSEEGDTAEGLPLSCKGVFRGVVRVTG
jgi:hypothetical protein